MPVCGFANLFSPLQNSAVQSTEKQSWRVYYSSVVGKGILQLKSVLYGPPPALQPAPSSACLHAVGTDKFPEVPARCLKTKGKPNQNKPDVAGCFNLQEELCSSRLVPS